MVRLLGKDGPDWDSLEDPCAKADNDTLESTSGRCEGFKVQSINPKWVNGVVVDKPHSFEWNCNEDNCWRKKFLHSEHRVRTGTSHWYSGSLDVQEALQIRERLRFLHDQRRDFWLFINGEDPYGQAM